MRVSCLNKHLSHNSSNVPVSLSETVHLIVIFTITPKRVDEYMNIQQNILSLPRQYFMRWMKPAVS